MHHRISCVDTVCQSLLLAIAIYVDGTCLTVLKHLIAFYKPVQVLNLHHQV